MVNVYGENLLSPIVYGSEYYERKANGEHLYPQEEQLNIFYIGVVAGVVAGLNNRLFCINENNKRNVLLIISKYIKNHPEKWKGKLSFPTLSSRQQRLLDLIVPPLKENFPCKKEK